MKYFLVVMLFIVTTRNKYAILPATINREQIMLGQPRYRYG